MDIEKELLKEHSKKQCLRIVKYVGEDPLRFKELMKCFLTGEYRVIQRAAWPVSYCVEDHPFLIKPYFKDLVAALSKANLPEAVPRNTMRLLQTVQIPERWEGPIMDFCFKYISSPQAATAVKAFSITVLENLSKKYPEIIPELKLVLEERWDQETPAYHSRARKFLKTLNSTEQKIKANRRLK